MCTISTSSTSARSSPSQPSTCQKFKYVESQADAYQCCLTAELLLHLVPLLTGTIGFDTVVAILITCMTEAAQQTLPYKQKRSVQNTVPRNPWFDADYKAAKKKKNRVYYSNASDQGKQIAVQCFHAVTDRVKKACLEKRAAELCEVASKDPSGFWTAFKTQKHNVCPVEFGTSVRAAAASCLNALVTSNELHDCIKRLKRNKSAGIDGILSEMVKDGSEVMHSCLLVIFNLMLVSHFPTQLSVGLITAVYKSGDKSDMSKYQGITVGSVIAKLFAMILNHRIAVWAEDEGIKAKGQAGFRKDFCTTDNIFILKALIDKQKQTRRGKASEKLYCCFVDFKTAFDCSSWLAVAGAGVRWNMWTNP